MGKLHVYPQRDRIGFDDALIVEECRYEFGEVDDYQIWLAERGYTGEEFMPVSYTHLRPVWSF